MKRNPICPTTFSVDHKIQNVTEIHSAVSKMEHVDMTYSLCICFMHFVQITCKSFDVYFSGASVRNIQAFQVLQSVFLKSNSAALCCTILDAISSVYHADNANYFILEGQYTLSQFAEKIHLKPQEIQVHLCPTYHISMCNYV